MMAVFSRSDDPAMKQALFRRRSVVIHSVRNIAFILIVALSSLPQALASDRLPIFVSIAPQKYFVQQIGGDLVDVQIMVPPGADPHTYEPKPRQMVAIATARLYFAIGVEFEKVHLKKIVSMHPQMEVVHMDRGIEKIPMPAHRRHRAEEVRSNKADSRPETFGSASADRRHSRDGLDPHIWLSPPLVKIQARTILKALQGSDPLHRSHYESNFQQFSSRIDELDVQLQAIFENEQGLQFMVFHPAWGYFARAYGLKQLPVEIEGKNPKPAQVKQLIEHARKNRIKVIFVQPQFSAKSARLIAQEIGGEVAFVDPMAENWSANLREVAIKFKNALE
jgi:zinc transport system substrate-binding protein